MSELERIADWLMGRDSAKARCKHEWVMKGSRVVEVFSANLTTGRRIPTSTRTEVLYVCQGACKQAITKNLQGKWTDEQLKGTQP